VRRVVVIGGGLAGLQTLVALRTRGYDGDLTLLCAEPRPPYDRPPLSKAVLLGETDDPTLKAAWDDLGVDVRLGLAATGLRPGVVQTARGDMPYDGAVIATGAEPVLPFDAGAGPHVHVLRTLDDALSLRAALVRGARVGIVGAGWIGAEVATAAARGGCAVTVVEARAEPLAGALPLEVGRRTRRWYATAGIDLRLGVAVRGLDRSGIWLADGCHVAADVVVVGVGVRPATGWLARSPVARDRVGAVLADAGLRASLPGVFAVGDCAAWESARYGRRLRVEHWDTALRAPDVVAANLLGEVETFDPVPYFWSDQFGRTIQVAGLPPGAPASPAPARRGAGAGDGAAAHLVWRGDPDQDPTWSACWVSGGRLTAMVALDRPRDLLQGRRVIERGTAVDVRRLADPAVPVRDAVRG
jgi:3-phenylpropionate/trans-cinnamate dioxygenase ferredoxin reductase subunit